jgi:hypothetical protein
VAQERTRIARELHYSVGQELVGIALQLDSAAARLAERGPVATLTVRKLEVLELVSKGLSNREIAAALGCSDTTAMKKAEKPEVEEIHLTPGGARLFGNHGEVAPQKHHVQAGRDRSHGSHARGRGARHLACRINRDAIAPPFEQLRSVAAACRLPADER